MTKKICSKCKIEKTLDCFSNRKSSKDGKRCSCKKCDIESLNKWKNNNKEKVKIQRQKYTKKNSQKNLERGKVYRQKYKEKSLERSRKWRENNKEYFVKYHKDKKSKIYSQIIERKKTDIIFKITSHHRSKINKILGSNKNNKTFDVIGCSPKQLKEHLENKFTDGMTWENHGLYGWHIDHIIPLSSAKTEEDLIKLCHYTNLQPLWAEDNLRKSNKVL